MAITLVPKYVRALAEQLNAYYRVFRGTDPDSIDLRLNGGGRFAVHHSGTNAVVFQVTDAGATGAYQPGDITTPDLADGAVTSAKILDNEIVNGDINAAAAIALTKIAHVGANNVLRSTGGVNVGGQVVSGDIANDTIVDADVNSAAGILVTKIAHVGAGNVLRSTGTQNVGGPLVAADIPNNSITSAKIADNEIVNADINAAAGIVYGKLALTNGVVNADINAGAAIAPSKLAGVTAGQILKDVGSGVVGGGLVVDANVAAAGTANIALGKLAPGVSGLVKSNGTAISAGNQLGSADLPTGGAAIITSAMIVDGTIATADMTVNSINGDRIADGTIVGAKISGGAPPPNGTGGADAYKAYATGSAGTTVSLQQVVTAMLAANAVTVRVASVGGSTAPTLGATGVPVAIGDPFVDITIPAGQTADVIVFASLEFTEPAAGYVGGIVGGYVTYVTGPYILFGEGTSPASARVCISGTVIFQGLTAASYRFYTGYTHNAGSIQYLPAGRRLTPIVVMR